MYRIIFGVMIALSTFGMPAAAADDNSTCASGAGDDAIAACSRLIKRNPKNATAHARRAQAYDGRGEYDLAIADLNVVLRLTPAGTPIVATIYYVRGGFYHKKRDFDRAIADYDQAIRLQPDYAPHYSERGGAYNGKGEYDRAIADCTRAIQLNPQFEFAYFNRGIAYQGKGDFDRAIADYDQAIRLDPNHADAYANRGYAYGAKRDHDRAISDYDQAIRLKPSNDAAYANRAVGYGYKGDYDRAIGDYHEAIRLNPNNVQAYDGRGYSFTMKGDYDRAISDLDYAIRLAPTYGNAYANRSNAYLHKGDYDRAIADANEAIRLDAKEASFYRYRGKAYEAKNDPGRALADFEQALNLDPNDADARRGRERIQVLLAKRSDPGSQTASARPALPAKRALVIGVNAYPNLGPAAQLERAVADADAVGDKLAALGFQVTRLTTAPKTTLEALIHGFDDFRNTVAPNDMVVLFYAGHGMGLPDGTYLVPSDVREASLQVEATAKRAAISENELTDGLRKARAGIVVAVIDACRNDLFSKASQRALGERGLRPVETAGIFKLYSASEGQTALDRLPGSDASRNSVFTRVFLKAIGTPGLNLNTLGATVRDEVHELARTADHVQIPAVYDKLIGSTRVYFAGETAAAGR